MCLIEFPNMFSADGFILDAVAFIEQPVHAFEPGLGAHLSRVFQNHQDGVREFFQVGMVGIPFDDSGDLTGQLRPLIACARLDSHRPYLMVTIEKTASAKKTSSPAISQSKISVTE